MTQQSFNPFPFGQIRNMSDVIRVLTKIIRERDNDRTVITNLNKVFMEGRKVAKIPTGSSDIAATDRVGDFNYDADYLYICVDDSGAAWRRVALATW